MEILVTSSIDVDHLCIKEAKVRDVMHINEDMRDDKIIAVVKNDMAVNYINELAELPPHTMIEL